MAQKASEEGEAMPLDPLTYACDFHCTISKQLAIHSCNSIYCDTESAVERLYTDIHVENQNHDQTV